MKIGLWISGTLSGIRKYLSGLMGAIPTFGARPDYFRRYGKNISRIRSTSHLFRLNVGIDITFQIPGPQGVAQIAARALQSRTEK